MSASSIYAFFTCKLISTLFIGIWSVDPLFQFLARFFFFLAKGNIGEAIKGGFLACDTDMQKGMPSIFTNTEWLSWIELQLFRLWVVLTTICLPSLESICLCLIYMFAYILKSVPWQSLYKTVNSIDTKIDDDQKLSHENLIPQLMNSNDYYVNCVHLIVLWNERQIDLALFGILDKCYDVCQCCNCTLIFKLQ